MEEINNNSLWVFGYGSLVWKPGFQPGQTAIGYVTGLARRFWQGNETHRGVPGSPGRVATLVEERDAVTHGIALELKGEEALDYLNNREMKLGGYLQKIVTFHPSPVASAAAAAAANDEGKEVGAPFPVLVFVATPQSKHWLGPDCLVKIAKQVVSSRGPSGHNVEYVIKLCQWLRKTFPDVHDEHLATLEINILEQVRLQNLNLDLLMGDDAVEEVAGPATPRRVSQPAGSGRQSSYRAACEHKELRCVKL